VDPVLLAFAFELTAFFARFLADPGVELAFRLVKEPLDFPLVVGDITGYVDLSVL